MRDFKLLSGGKKPSYFLWSHSFSSICMDPAAIQGGWLIFLDEGERGDRYSHFILLFKLIT
jgi:hypothetical protein